MQPSSPHAFELPPSLWPTLQRIATGEGWPPQGEISAALLVERASGEGLLPLLFAERELPAPVAAVLEKRSALARAEERRSQLFREAAQRLRSHLSGVDFVFLKGADYSSRLYLRPEMRPMRDLDILVPAASIDAVSALLTSAGVAREFPAGPVAYLPSHYERVFRLGSIGLDVHQAFLPPWRLRVDYGALWERRVAVSEPCPAFRLSDLDALVHHAVAMAKDEFSVPLVRWIDLWLLLRRNPELVPGAIDRARLWRAERPLYGAFVGLKRLFPEAGALLAAPDLERLLDSRTRRFLDRRVLPDPGRREQVPRTRGQQLWRKFWLIGSSGRRVAFALHHLAAVARGRLLARRSAAQPRTPGPLPGT